MYLLNQYLENFRTTLFRQTQFAEFEKLIHEKEAAGESLNAANLKKWYLDINKKYYGTTMISDEGIAMEWSRIPHFYRNFYVYQYATSFAASQALAKQVMDEGQPAVDRIRTKFLSAGNSKPPIEVLKAAGVDMSTAKPIEQAMELFKQTLDEFEALVAQAEKENPKPAPGKPIHVTVNGKAQTFDTAPINSNGTVLVPLRVIFESLGANIKWDGATQTVTATKGDTTVTLKLGASTATVNGKTVTLQQPAQTINSRALVPTRFVAEALGAIVSWDSATNTVVITN
jgi:oligoendopeptidase F